MENDNDIYVLNEDEIALNKNSKSGKKQNSQSYNEKELNDIKTGIHSINTDISYLHETPLYISLDESISKSFVSYENYDTNGFQAKQNKKFKRPTELAVIKEDALVSKDTLTIVYQILVIMIPCMMNMLLQEGLLQVNIIYASKLNDVNILAGMGLANTLINCTTISITYGLSGVLETFVSQSYGSKEYQLCGVHLNRQIFLITCLFIPMSVVLFFSEYIMINYLGQLPGPSHYCQLYMRIGIIGLYLECIVNSLAFFFTSLQRSFLPMFTQFLSIFVHLLGCQIFVNYFNWGLYGLAVSMNITYAFSLLFIYLVVKFRKDKILKQVWAPFNKEIFFKFKQFVSMAISGLLITSFEEWSNQGLQLISGFLGEKNQATMVISFNVMQMVYVIPMCIGSALSALVGAAMGEGDAKAAIKITQVTFIFSITVLIILTIILQFTTYDIVKIYTDQDNFARKVTNNFLIYTYILVFDGIQINLIAVIKALGLQESAQNLSLFSYFFICIPLAYIFSVQLRIGIDGLWYSLSVAIFLLIGLFSNLILKQNWHQVSLKIKDEINQQVENQRLNVPLISNNNKLDFLNSSKINQDLSKETLNQTSEEKLF